MGKKDLIIGAVGVALLMTAIAGMIGWYTSNTRVRALEAQLQELRRQEMRSAVLQSVSKQMEQIAFQQKEISDEQREEALQQTRVANEMRERSEAERRNAIQAQQQAVVSERKALDAYDQAQSQREIAEQQRVQAEFSKRVADTLSYVTLGRTLGSLAMAQLRAGNDDLANLLGFAACLYTSRYKGDIYNPSVYQSLSLCSQSKSEWPRHEGAIRDLEFMPQTDNELVTVSSYGEVLYHVREGNRLKTTALLRDRHYDFRDVYIYPENKNIYAVSRTGDLFIKTSKNSQILPLANMLHPLAIEPMQDKRHLLIVGENKLIKLDMTTNTIVGSQDLDFKVTLCSRYDYAPAIFDDKGKMHTVRDLNKFSSRKVPILGNVSAFASSKSTGYEAYGLNDGTIFLLDKQKNIHRLVGHRSRISKLKLNGSQLYSSSFDGTVNLWMTNKEKIEPMPLVNTNNWILHFTFDSSKNYLWTAGQRGTISEALISTQAMFDKLQKKVNRNLSQEEWNYYIGRNVPYESFLLLARKGVRL